MSENGESVATRQSIVVPMERGLPFELPVLERARRSRDPRFDGRFYLGVVSTGIYCRPVCPAAPKAHSRRVRYFVTAAGAHEAGFRPCLRCRPESAPGTPAWLGTSAVVHRALRLIQDGALDGSSVPQFAARLGLGARQLDRLFAQHVGASPLALAQTRRLHFAKQLIDGSSLPMTEIALAAGYGSLRRFNDALRNAYGRSPRALRMQCEQDTSAGEVNLTLAYRPPYDWPRLGTFLRLRAIAGVETFDENGYARMIQTDDGHASIRVRPLPGRNALELRVRGAPPTALFRIAATVRRVFDLAADPDQIARDLGADPHLRALVGQRPGLRIPGAWDPFECAVRAILGQQVSVPAARTLASRLVERLGRSVSGVQGLIHLFPTPQALATGNLDGLGITRARVTALKALAAAVTEGRLVFDRSPAQVTENLKALPGFGEWTTQYIALRALGEPDALPGADLVLRRMASGGHGPMSTKEMERRAERWRPWRSYAVIHLWCAASERAAPRVHRSTHASQLARPT